jgi:PhnB protein
MLAVNPYLNFDGNTEEAFNFYKSVFGGEFLGLMRFKDIPGNDQVPDGAKDKIMHISLQIAPNVILMGTDAIESMGQILKVGNNTHFLLQTESKEEADKLFNSLSKDGKIEMSLADQFWGDYYGNFTDKFGICWMISFTKK